MDLSKFLTEEPRKPSGRMNWAYEFPNGHTASVINSPYDDEPFRFEVLSTDPADAGRGFVTRNLTTEQVEAKLTAIADLSQREVAA